jgi:hypothetical protein
LDRGGRGRVQVLDVLSGQDLDGVGQRRAKVGRIVGVDPAADPERVSAISSPRSTPPQQHRAGPSVLAGPAAALPEVVDFGPHQRLLDIEGGTGLWSIAIAQRHQHITGAVLELPTAVELARSPVAAAGLGQRIM